jgi:uncharacterized damage-inducible protein DinB
MDPRVTALADMLRLNSRLYQNCLAGLTDQAARERLSGAGPTNSAAFVAAHLVDSRYYLLDCLGVKQQSPLTGAKGGFNNIADVTAFPALADIRTAWHSAGELLGKRLAALTAADLDTPLAPGFPIETQTTLGLLSFMVQHESYHLGQLGLLRKHSGLPAMAYD